MASGWAGLSLVCYGEPLQAAQSSCSGVLACAGITGEGGPGPGGSKAFTYQTTGGQTASLYVQPCDRIDASFFAGLMPVVIPAAIAILCAKKVWRMFDSHA